MAKLLEDDGSPASTGVRAPVPAPWVERLFDDAVAAYEWLGPAEPPALMAEEAEAVAGVSPRRRAEFATGRGCAHAALSRCGFGPAPLLPDADRAPCWPQGAVGSITHTVDYALAVAAPVRHGVAAAASGGPARTSSSDADRRASAGLAPGAGLGVDAERAARMTPAVVGRVCTPAEQAWLARLDRDRWAVLATAVFGAKEAFYKAQHPCTRRWVGFAEVAAVPTRDGLELVPLTESDALAAWRWPIVARWAERGGLVVVAVTAEAAEQGSDRS
jgi:4'-phosphopantetheinyl transferase EntD